MADRYSPDLFAYATEPPSMIFPTAGESVKPSRDWLGLSVKSQVEPSSHDRQGEEYCTSKFGKGEVTEDEAIVISDDSEDEVTRSEASSSAHKISVESGKGASSCASGDSSRGKKKFVFKKIVTGPVDLVTSPCDATESSVPLSHGNGLADDGGKAVMHSEPRSISVQSAAVDDDSSFEVSPIVGRPVGVSYRSRLNFTKAPVGSNTPQTANSFTTYRDPQRRRGSNTNEDAEVRPQRRTQSPGQPAVSPVGPSSSLGVDSTRHSSLSSPESAGDCSAGRASSIPPAPVRLSVKPEVLQLSKLSFGDLNKRIEQKKLIRNMTNLSALSDGGRKLQVGILDLEAAVEYKQQQMTSVFVEDQFSPGSPDGICTHSLYGEPCVAVTDRNANSEGAQQSWEETNSSRSPGSFGASPARTSSDPESSPRSEAVFPGGSRHSADSTGSARSDSAGVRPEVEALTRMSLEEIQRRLEQKKIVSSATNLSALPDGGRRLRQMIADLEAARDMKLRHSSDSADRPDNDNNLSRQQIQHKLQQLRTQYSTSSQHSGSSETDNLSKEIVALQKTLMKMDLAGEQLPSANGVVGCESLPRGPGVGLQARHVPLNKPSSAGDHGGVKQRTAKLIAQPSSYEEMLKEGGRTTSFITDEQRSLEARARESLRDFGSVPAHLMSALYAANPEINKLYGGRMTAARHREALNVTTDALERLHTSLRSRPAADTTSPGPACLTVPLMPHQLHAMAWLQWRERQEPPGGILADDMGLGKTLTMIAHCLRCTELREARLQQQRQLREADDTAASDSNDEEHQWLSKAKSMKARENVVMSRGTLVVCPASVLNQWESEVKRRTSGHVSVQIYHGNARNVSARQLARNDFVLTTYGIIQRELDDELEGDAPATAAKGCLARVCWERVVLDESHQVRNPATKTARAVYRIRAGRRWAVTGTPVHNKREDVFSMMRFLRMAPFNEKEIWKRWIDNSAQGEERLSLLIRALVLRRSKTDISPITGKSLVNLPERQKLLHMVKLSPEEKAVYEEVFEYSRAALQEFIKLQEQREYEKELVTNPLAKPPSSLRHAPGSEQLGLKGDGAAVRRPVSGEIKQHHILVQLLRLRQICCHPALAKTMLESGEHQTAGFDLADEADALGDRLGGMSLGGDRAGSTAEEEDTAAPDVMTADNPVFQKDFRSAKLRLLLEKLSPVLARGEKAVVVSQWSTMLSIVADHLDAERVQHCTISGAVNVKDRQPLVERFNNDPRGPPVLLLSIGAGGVGLNLVGGNHLFLLDPHWNPQMEEQAGDRVYRVGQTRPVFMHRLICEGSLEQRVMELQRNKMELASSVLSGQARQATNRLTLSDLKTLFQLK